MTRGVVFDTDAGLPPGTRLTTSMTIIGHLNALESVGLVRLAQVRPEVAYLFRHALIQDAAYGTLVRQDRQSLHRAIGEVLERLHAGRLSEVAPVLARHFDEAGDDRRTLDYYTMAGDAAALRYANLEAAAHYARALDVARRASHVDSDLIRHLYLKRGQALQSGERWQESWANYVELGEQARARGDRSLELTSLIECATLRIIYSPIFDPAQAEALSHQALALAQELGNGAAEARILWNLMRITAQMGQHPQQAIAYGEQSLRLARKLGLSEQLAYTLNDIQYAYRGAGQLDRVLAVLGEARDLWRERGNLHMLADNLNMAAMTSLFMGDFDPALHMAGEAQRISQSSNNVAQQALSSLIVGWGCMYRGEMGRALEVLEDGLRLETAVPSGPLNAVLSLAHASLGAFDRALMLAQSAFETLQATTLFAVQGPMVLGALANAHRLRGDVADAEALIVEARQILGQPLDVPRFPDADRVTLIEAELALDRQDYARATTVIDDLLTHLNEVRIRANAPEAVYVKSQILLARNQVEEGRKVLGEARAEAEANDSRLILWKILAALGQVEERCGNSPAARGLRQQACEIITFIADHCPSDLRASFLGLLDVRAVMSDT